MSLIFINFIRNSKPICMNYSYCGAKSSKLPFNETNDALMSVKYYNKFLRKRNHEQRTYGAVTQDSPR